MFLHYIWIDFKNEMNDSPKIPQNLLKKMQNCSKVNPDYEVMVWNGPLCHKLLVEHFPSYVELYDSLPYPIMRCDMIRFFILYRYGGLYVDFDRTCLKSFQDLFKDDPDVLVPYFKYGPLVFYNNDFIYAKAGSPFMKQCMDNIRISRLPTHSLKVLSTAGPLYLGRQLDRYKGSEKIVKLNKEVNGCDFCTCASDISEQFTFGDFSKTSWTGTLDAAGRFVVCHWYVILSLAIIAVLLARKLK
jgi:mannosyltransferase OCH1-like enzyme